MSAQGYSSSNHEIPIAVIGMACRLPMDINSPEQFWQFLKEGREAVSEIPAARWEGYASNPENSRALKNTTKAGHFLSDIAGFDAEFFGITPREAAEMDPQQRITLEVAWEALEHAGIPPADLAGGDTGVFIGVGTDDYGRRLLEDLPRIQAWTGIGSSLCAVPNRVSYTLDLRGPSLAVDTACSSSLAAIHLACASLRSGEAPVALAGGVMLMAGPGLTMVLDKAGAISPDGRSKAFSADADGYGRGEGCGVLVLKRLDDAENDGDRVLAVIRGSGVHQDGKTNGIMAPSGEAQAHLLRRTWERSGLDPATVDYVEAHGTGTPTGDPMEASALASVFGAGRAAGDECLIGSVKTNIGHLEAGSGVAGMIKAILALREGLIPASLHAAVPNPAVPWATSGLRVVDTQTPWPDRPGTPRRAGVSGYGYGGTIAHVILEAAPEPSRPAPGTVQSEDAPPASETSTPRLLPLSGSSPDGLRTGAERLLAWLSDGTRTVRPADVGHTLAHRRAHLAHRAAVVATDRESLVAGLRQLAEAAPQASPQSSGPVWVFSGHGSQWTGMGRGLLRDEPAFAAALDEITPVFEEEMKLSPRQVLIEGDFESTDRIQAMIFAVQIGLAAVLRSYGVTPAAVIGHSVGEIAASVAAGALTPQDGARLACRRSLLLREVAGQGSMAMVNLPFAEVEATLGNRRDVVAAISASPESTVVSGDPDAIDALFARWEREQVRVRRVNSDVAFHSAHMDGLTRVLADACHDLSPRVPTVPLYSTALSDPRDTAPRDGVYWAANLRNPVRFTDAARAALADGHRLFVEISAHPVITHSLVETFLADEVADASATFLLRRDTEEPASLLRGVGELYRHGTEVDWTRLQPDGELADLPVTGWQHERHWREHDTTHAGDHAGHDTGDHALLGTRSTVWSSTPLHAWRTRLDVDNRPYPGDHPVRGTEIIPAAVLLNTFLRASADTGEYGARPVLTDMALRVPVAVVGRRELQVVHQDGGLRLAGRVLDEDTTDDFGSWLTHTTSSTGEGGALEQVSLAAFRQRCAEEADPDSPVTRLAGVGVAAMGFPWEVRELRLGDGELLALVSVPEEEGADPHSWAPAFDAALSIASTVFPGPQVLRMPARIARVHAVDAPPSDVWIAVRATDQPDTADVHLLDASGRTLAALGGLAFGRIDADPTASAHPRRLVHESVWRPAETGVNRPVTRALFVDPEGRLGDRLADRWRELGVHCRVVGDVAGLGGADGAGADTVVLVTPRGPAEESVWALASVVRALDADRDAGTVRVWCVTEGVSESVAEHTVAQSALWGLGRIAATEHPNVWGGVVDLPSGTAEDATTEHAAALLLSAVRSAPFGEVVALRDGTLLVERLARVQQEAVRGPLRLHQGGTYLITGGFGALGLEVARWLAGQGARRIVLAGRSGLPPRADWPGVSDPSIRRRIEAVTELEALGVTVHAVQVDITDLEQARRALDADALGLPRFRGVVHAAGVLDNAFLTDLSRESLRTVLAPKVQGAQVLHELFPAGSLDFLALFSSAGLLLGLPGQASYAAGNALLDGLARHRRALGSADTVSLAWTSWRGLGMSTSSAVIDLELAARGTADITADEAFHAWDFAYRHALPYAAVLRTLPPEPGVTRPLILEGLPTDEALGAVVDQGAGSDWEAVPADELEAYVISGVADRVAEQMNLPVAAVDPHRPLAEMGLDSIMSVVIRRGLERQFRLSLPSTLLWNQPTVTAIGRLLTRLLTEDNDDAPSADDQVPATA
ncbi:type I polyketide synthase [Streptomyces sp. NPDC057621]|uniref:type I polyketide synthase n=1 Tax=Streptomyces sp. NPDC057621 TaxID=3346186 RepID=UPI0036929678